MEAALRQPAPVGVPYEEVFSAPLFALCPGATNNIRSPDGSGLNPPGGWITATCEGSGPDYGFPLRPNGSGTGESSVSPWSFDGVQSHQQSGPSSLSVGLPTFSLHGEEGDEDDDKGRGLPSCFDLNAMD